MMLSSTNRREDAARCRELGVDSCLTKPIRQSTLLDAIMTALGASASVEDRAAAAPAGAAAGAGRRKLRLLLAEDNAVNQRLATSLLKKRGHQVVVVGNGREALNALDDGPPFDAVLMDVQMPEMDGFVATAAIRAREAGSGVHTPIIAMTAHALKGDRDRCLAAGMDGYVTKPLRPQELFDALEGLPVASVAGASAAGSIAEPVVFDRAAALERMGGDEDLLKELVGLFLHECPRRTAEIREALTRRDAAKLRQAAHTLKGSVGNFVAWEVFEGARQLEAIAHEQDWEHAEEAWATLEAAIDRLKPAMAQVCQATAS
jgi:CheY-like chemotaxis protein